MRAALALLLSLLLGACAGQPQVAREAAPAATADALSRRAAPPGTPPPAVEPPRVGSAGTAEEGPKTLESARKKARLISPAPKVTKEAIEARVGGPPGEAWPEPGAAPPHGRPSLVQPAPPLPNGAADGHDQSSAQASITPAADGDGISVFRGTAPAGEALTPMVWVTDRSEDLQAASRAAREALHTHDGVRALAIYQEILTLVPGERSAQLGAAAALRLLGRPAVAEGIFLDLLRKNPQDRFVEVALWGLRGERAPREALAQLRRLAWQDPEDGRVRAQIGLILARHGAFDRAIAEFQVALRLDPANERYRADLVTLREARQRARNAVEDAPIGASAPRTE